MANPKKNDFKWKGPKVDCYIDALKKGNFVFYRSFTIHGEVFEIGDFAIINKGKANIKNQQKICRILSVFESNESWHADSKYRGSVRWYSFARNLASKCNPQMIEFDRENEVIEDYRDVDVIISLSDIVRKCRVVFGTEDDPSDLIKREKLNREIYFACRYKIKGRNKEIEPIFCAGSEFNETEIEVFEERQNTPKTTPKQKIQNTIILESDGEEDLGRVMNAVENLKLISPHQKKSVKRNLNDSFADISDLNYSIIEDSPASKEPLKIKLRPSQTQNPKVIIKKLDDEVVQHYLSPEKPKRPTRRSGRCVERISYAELITPEKFTPEKRGRKPIVSTEQSNNEKLSSVKKRSHNENNNDKQFEREKQSNPPNLRPRRSVSQPKKYSEDDFYLDDLGYVTPTKKNRYDPFVAYVTPVRSVRSKRRNTEVCEDMRKSVLKQNAEYSTPKKVTLRDDIVVPKTPKTPKSQNHTPKSILKTPGSRNRLIRDGIITPSVQKRDKAVKDADTPLMKARSQLHVSHVPIALPCREKEYSDVFNFLEGKLNDGCGGCMYISGVPGTGKTATVTSVIRNLQELADDGDVPDFDYVSINGMRLTEPRQAYVEILKQLGGKTVPWEQAQTTLDNRFSKAKKGSKPVVMLVDELDILCTKRQDVVYNLLDWPTKANNQLVVVTVANTMDLPERLLMGRVTSRLGLTRLTFQPYSYKQLQEIVAKRLEGINSFNPDAIQLVARKVASVSGDARRALDICRRATEIAESEDVDSLVSMKHVNDALNAMITQPKVQAIRHCTRLEQLILQAVVAEVERTGVEETTFQDVHTMLISVAALDGFQMVSRTLVSAAITRLSACRLLLTDQKSSDMYQKIILNVSADDVYYALRRD